MWESSVLKILIFQNVKLDVNTTGFWGCVLLCEICTAEIPQWFNALKVSLFVLNWKNTYYVAYDLYKLSWLDIVETQTGRGWLSQNICSFLLLRQ